MRRGGWPVLLLAFWALLACIGPFLAHGPDHIDLARILARPWQAGGLGYDDLGRPILDRLIAGARTSFIVAFAVVVVAGALGTLIGAIAGYVGGKWDHLAVRVIDIFMAFPGLLLAVALAGVMGPGVSNVVIALSMVGWVGFARLARAQVLSLKHRDHILASRALGSGDAVIVRRHLLPLIAAPLLVEATFAVAGAVIAEAGLSFLGLGVQPPTASWGSMIRDGVRYLLVAPHMVLAPGIALMAVVLAVNLLGERLRDALDVRSRERR